MSSTQQTETKGTPFLTEKQIEMILNFLVRTIELRRNDILTNQWNKDLKF